jgi:hypothetical protein
MKSEDRDRLLDRLLDGALAAQHVEPREGLEQRILANLRARPTTRPWWRWIWVPAALAAAVLLILGLRVMRRPEPVGNPAIATPAPIAPVPSPKQPEAPAAMAKHRAPRGSSPRTRTVAAIAAPPLPRRETFPSPTPLTAEERMMLTLVRHNRTEAVLVAQTQENEREKVQKYFETGKAPEPQPEPAQPMR